MCANNCCVQKQHSSQCQIVTVRRPGPCAISSGRIEKKRRENQTSRQRRNTEHTAVRINPPYDMHYNTCRQTKWQRRRKQRQGNWTQRMNECVSNTRQTAFRFTRGAFDEDVGGLAHQPAITPLYYLLLYHRKRRICIMALIMALSNFF